MLSVMHVLYKTKDCVRCPLAARSMVRAGVEFREVFLDDPVNVDLLEQLRSMGFLSVPIVETPDGRFLENLAVISEEFRG